MFDLLGIIIKGGPVMAPLLVCSIIALAVVIERFLFWRRISSRQAVEEMLDLVGEELFDAAFSLYYFIGFVSIPFWTLITGGVMTRYGFGPAFTVISTSYLLAMSLLVLLRTPVKQPSPR